MTDWQSFQQIAFIILVPIMPWAFGLGLVEVVVLATMDILGGLLSKYIKQS
jgi:hypothetical protein